MENESNARDRIEAIIHLTGLKQYEFASKIGVSNGAISHITSPTGRKAEMTENIAYRIVQSFPELNISYDWLMNGSGSMYNQTPQQQPTLFDTPTPSIVESHEEPVKPIPEPVKPQQSSIVNADGPRPVEQSLPAEPVKDATERRVLSSKPIDNGKETPGGIDEWPPRRELERIVMFYSDGTFVEYRPQK